MLVRFFPFVVLLGCAPSVITEEQEIASDEDIESSWKDEEEDSKPEFLNQIVVIYLLMIKQFQIINGIKIIILKLINCTNSKNISN